jgi:hypothetical protein
MILTLPASFVVGSDGRINAHPAIRHEKHVTRKPCGCGWCLRTAGHSVLSARGRVADTSSALAQLILALLLDAGDTFLVEEYTYSHILESVAEPKGYVPIGARPSDASYERDRQASSSMTALSIDSKGHPKVSVQACRWTAMASCLAPCVRCALRTGLGYQVPLPQFITGQMSRGLSASESEHAVLPCSRIVMLPRKPGQQGQGNTHLADP